MPEHPLPNSSDRRPRLLEVWVHKATGSPVLIDGLSDAQVRWHGQDNRSGKDTLDSFVERFEPWEKPNQTDLERGEQLAQEHGWE